MRLKIIGPNEPIQIILRKSELVVLFFFIKIPEMQYLMGQVESGLKINLLKIFFKGEGKENFSVDKLYLT